MIVSLCFFSQVRSGLRLPGSVSALHHSGSTGVSFLLSPYSGEKLHAHVSYPCRHTLVSNILPRKSVVWMSVVLSVRQHQRGQVAERLGNRAINQKVAGLIVPFVHIVSLGKALRPTCLGENVPVLTVSHSG